MTRVASTSAEVPCTFLTCLSKRGKNVPLSLTLLKSYLKWLSTSVLNSRTCEMVAKSGARRAQWGESSFYLNVLNFWSLFLQKPSWPCRGKGKAAELYSDKTRWSPKSRQDTHVSLIYRDVEWEGLEFYFPELFYSCEYYRGLLAVTKRQDERDVFSVVHVGAKMI